MNSMKIRIIQSCFFAVAFAGLAGATKAQTAPAVQQTQRPGQNQPSSPAANAEGDAAQEAAKLVQLTRDWAEGKLSTPGISAKARQVTNKIDNGALLVQYNVTLVGAPKDQTYTFLSWPINESQPIEQMKGLALGFNGMVVCGSLTPEQCSSMVTKQKHDPVDLTFYPAKGELVRLSFVSADGKSKVFFAAVPEPILKKDKSCSLEAVRLMPKFEVAMIRAKGFQPNEDLHLESKSYEEAVAKQAKADANGEYVSALQPFVKGKQNGKTIVTLKGASCAPSISFEWGK